jgi:threonine dehydrogenase-like Zn-dependent dehydrogenase
VTRPNITSPTEAIVRITRAAICGSDLHNYRGFFPPEGPVGHEAVGIVSEIGSAVTNVRVGDHVIIPSSASNGYLLQVPEPEDFFFGLQGEWGAWQNWGYLGLFFLCSTLLTVGVSSLSLPLSLAYTHIHITGEYARVQVADTNLIRTPLTNETLTPELERDYVLVSDVWPTSWQSIDRSGFQPGDNIAIWGAGPVGLLAAYTARLRGAGRIYVVDHVQQRLDRAASIGAVPVNFVTQDVVGTLLAAEPQGITRLVDCVGFEALTANLTVDTNIVMRQMIAVSQLDGGIGIGGVYIMPPKGPSNPRIAEVSREFVFDAQTYFTNRLVMQGGLLEARAVGPTLVNLIATGVAHPSALLSGSEISIDQVPEYYARFERWEETKVFINFPW